MVEIGLFDYLIGCKRMTDVYIESLVIHENTWNNLTVCKLLLIGLMGRVFTNGPGDQVQSQVESYQRLLKWYLIPPCLTLSNIRDLSRVKWSNPKKRVAPFPIPQCSSYRKGSLRVTLDYIRQLYFTKLSREWIVIVEWK